MAMRNRLMLVVDDDKISRMLPGILLRPYGITVLECDNGLEALKLLDIHHVCCMLIDISMPSFSGLELLQSILAHSKYPQMRLVAYTADARLGHACNFQKLGFHQLLIKPVTAHELLATVDFPSNGRQTRTKKD
jgi:CheY-like chemotaxis protein